jgi:serine/threonine protein kinase
MVPGDDDFVVSLIGQVLDGRYRIEALLGQGGMGAVFRGHQLAMDRRVAIKVLRPHLVGDGVAARRFAREARGTFKVDSEHAVKVLDFAIADGGTPYMVLEHLDGRTVAAELTVDGPLAPVRALKVAGEICHALAAAHRIGLVHRDIKPDNVMLVRQGADPDVVKVLDFGLARLMEGAGPGVLSRAALTQGDMVFGTPEYMSPEQATGQTLDGRADVYALGATLFEMLTGRPPFEAATPMALLAHQVRSRPPALADVRPGLGSLGAYAALDGLVQRCLAKAPAERPASAEALAAELAALRGALTPRGRVARAVALSETQEMAPLAATAEVPMAPMAGEISAGMPRVAGRRRWWLAAIPVAVAAVVVALASRRTSIGPSIAEPAAQATAAIPQPSPSPTPSPSPSPSPTPSPSPSPTPSPSPSPTPSPSPSPTPSPSPSPSPTPGRATSPALQRHLAAAAAARASGNTLRQLAEADAALRLAPASPQARFLLGDALITTGDPAAGCRYLKQARRLPAARQALAAARCPAD